VYADYTGKTVNANVLNEVVADVCQDEPMEKLMRQYCRNMHIKYGSVQFMFDGEQIDPSETPDSLELESDYCIDVITS